MYIYGFILGIALYSIGAGYLMGRRNIILNIVLGFSLLVCTYVIISGLMFWCDCFTLNRSGLLTFVVGLCADLLFLFGFIKRENKSIGSIFQGKFEFDKSYFIPLMILILTMPLCIKQFEIYGMGQDEGVYQAKAFALLEGENSNRVDLEEFHILNEEEKSQYIDFLELFTGYYRKTDFLEYNKQDQHCEAMGYYHGLPNMAALLAFSTLIFGMQGMKAINILMYIATVWIVFEIGIIQDWRKLTCGIVTLTTAISPLVIWVVKSSLTENLLTLAIVLFVYLTLLFQNINKSRYERLLVLLPVATFCYFHISAFMLIPLFNVIFWLLFIESKDRIYHKINMISLIIFASGFWMMLQISPEYAYKNLVRLLSVGFTRYTTWILPLIYCPVVMLITFLIDYFCKKKANIIENERIYENRIVIWIIRLIIIISMLNVGRWIWDMHIADASNLSGYDSLKQGYIASDNLYKIFQYSSIYANCLLSGCVVTSIAILYTLFKPNRFFNKKNMVIFVMFLYLVFICDGFVITEVPYYYYYARYLVYTVVICVLLGGILLEQINIRTGVIISAIGLVILLPYSIFLANNNDDSSIEYTTLYSLANSIESNSAVILHCDDDTCRTLWHIRTLTGAGLFPVFEDYNAQIEHLRTKYEHIYLLSDSVYGNMKGMIYSDNYFSREYENRGNFPMIPLINSVVEVEKHLYLYDIDSDIQWTDFIDSMYGLDDGCIPVSGVMFGPYITLLPGEYVLGVCIGSSAEENIEIQINAQKGMINILSDELQKGYNELNFEINNSYDDVEFVIYNTSGEKLQIESLKLK